MNNIYLKTSKLRKIAGFTVMIVISFLYFSTDTIAQPPCNGIPQGGYAFAPQNPVCPGAMFSVNLLGIPSQSDLTFQWLSSTDGINNDTIQGADSSQLLTSEMQPTYYSCIVTCTLSGQSSISVPVLVYLTQPVIQYPPAAVQLNNGDSTDPSHTGAVTFSSPCCTGAVTYSDSTSSNCCHQIIIRTWSITDCFNIVTTYVQAITVVFDSSDPVISCTPLGPGTCNTTPTPNASTITVIDDCPGTLTVSSSDAPGTLPCELVTTFTWTVTDQCGHSSTCTQIYSRIMDTESPVITCPGPVTLPCNSVPAPSPSLITATDNCGTPEISLISTSTISVGCLVTYTYTWRAIDLCGNFADCNQVVNAIFDLIPPVINCPAPDTLPCNVVPTPSASLISAADNCGTPSISLIGTSASTFDCITTTIYTWRATDGCGNIAECDQIIYSISDSIPPLISCPSEVALACNIIPTPIASAILATDNCGTPIITLNDSQISTVNCLTTYVYEWKATDACGNSSLCTQIIHTTSDSLPPVISCPSPDTLLCNILPSPSASLIVAFDNCGAPSISLVGTSASTVDCITATTYTWRATDDCGNIAECDQIIYSISDSIPPVITCPAETTLPCNTIPAPSASSISAADNCGTPAITLNDTHTSTVNCTTTYIYEWKATDACGNFSTCDQVISVVNDLDFPVIHDCPNTMSIPAELGQCGAHVSWTEPTADDNCGIRTFYSNYVSGDFYPAGTTTVIYTAIDSCGNTSTCQFDIYVNDIENPIFTNCVSSVNLNTDAGFCTSNYILLAPDALDNCGVDSVTLITPLIINYPVGTTNVKFKATDIHGNFVICSTDVIVADNELPVIHNCPANIVVDNDSALCDAIVSWVEPTATDNCSILSFISSHSPGNHFPVGTTTVSYTATDVNGNVEFCSFTVEVNDTEDPFILSHDIVTCDTVVNYDFIIGDNCMIDSYSYQPFSGSVFQPGTTTAVYVEAMDIHGNIISKYFDVSVLMPPSVIDSVAASDNEICLYDSVKFFVYMNTIGTNGEIKVYKNFCNTSVASRSRNEGVNLWSISILPDDTGSVTYYVRVESACDSTDCVPVNVSVIDCLPTKVTLHLKVFIEGYYQGGGLMTAAVDPVSYPLLSDTAIIELRDPAPPNNLSYQSAGVFDIHGDGFYDFPLSVDGNSYYIVFRHRNSIETWSSLPILFDPHTYYSFTDTLSKAYGNNLSNLGDGNYAVFSGDISDAGSAMVGIQDGIVESQDYADMENAVAQTLIGYLPEDITGDGVAESADYSLMENNVYFTIYVMRP